MKFLNAALNKSLGTYHLKSYAQCRRPLVALANGVVYGISAMPTLANCVIYVASVMPALANCRIYVLLVCLP